MGDEKARDRRATQGLARGWGRDCKWTCFVFASHNTNSLSLKDQKEQSAHFDEQGLLSCSTGRCTHTHRRARCQTVRAGLGLEWVFAGVDSVASARRDAS